MLFKENRPPFFAWASRMRGRSATARHDAPKLPQITEPSPELRNAVQRFRLGLQPQQRQADGLAQGRPVSYKAVATHRKASTRGGLASSDAMIVTRFMLQDADPGMSRLLGQKIEGRNVLDFQLGGLELAWHKDLMRALEERAAIWSVARLSQSQGHHLIEHIVVPALVTDGQLSLVGWFNPVGGLRDGTPDWSDIQFIGRERRAERISSDLLGFDMSDFNSPDAERRSRHDILSFYRSNGAI